MAEQKEYIRDKLVEKRGKTQFDKYKQRHLRLLKNGILEYWTVKSAESASIMKGTINIMIEGLNEVQSNKTKGVAFHFGWELQTDTRTYYFASQDDKERRLWIKQIQDIYVENKNSNISSTASTEKAKKSYMSIIKETKGKIKSEGIGALRKGAKEIAMTKKAKDQQQFLMSKEKKKVIATLDTSSIFGCYEVVDEDKKEYIECKEEEEEKKKSDDNVANKHQLMTLTLDELLTSGVNSFHSKLGCKASRVNKIASFNNDLVISNEFCQLAIGKGLMHQIEKSKENQWIIDELIESNKRNEYELNWSKLRKLKNGKVSGQQMKPLMEKSSLTKDKLKEIWKLSDIDRDGKMGNEEFLLCMFLIDTAKKGEKLPQKLPKQYIPPSFRGKKLMKKPLKINKRPVDDKSDDENEDGMPTPTVIHNGKIREKIDFRPGTNDFTICCEIYCKDLASGNTIISNKMNNEGIEIIAPRTGSRRVAVWMEGNELLNVGKTELFQETWYHITVVCKRANTEEQKAKLQRNDSLLDAAKKKEKFKIGHLTNMSGKEMMEKMTGKVNITAAATDFEVFLNGVSDGKLSLDGAPALDTMDCRIGSNVETTMGSTFEGEIKNFMIFDKALSEEEIYLVAHKKDNMSYSDSVLVSYIPESLKVQVPICNVKYNGPIHCALPDHMQWQPAMEPFTISAWILCSRAVSVSGSVIVSNLTTSNTGFELICPTKTKNVIGIQCTGTKKIQKKMNRENVKNKNKVAHNVGKFMIGSTLTKAIEKGAAKNQDISVPVGTTVIEKNKFYHIAITVQHVIQYGDKPDSTVFVAYVNGKQDGSYTQNVMYKYSGNDWTIGFNGHYKQETRFEGSIANLRMFQRVLTESEIACIYAADLRERRFDKNEDILYAAVRQTTDQWCSYNDDGSDIVTSNQNRTYFKGLKWCNGKFVNNDMTEGKVIILDDKGGRKSMSMNEIIKPKGLRFVPGSDAENITNLGGMIHGTNFDGNKWKIFSSDTKFLRHITSPSCFNLLTKLQPFPKHQFEEMIDNKSINNKYILNRLLYSTHELLKNVNNDKRLWPYFNEYILPWNIWKEQTNFELLQQVARRLQYKYKKMQFDLFNELVKTDWNVFQIKNSKHETIENRQDGFDGGLTVEIDENLVDKELVQQYDKQVATMILWGRCIILNKPFQEFMKKIFDSDKFGYHPGPPKTYERMVEKTVEYQSENAKFPAAYRICDVLRCSIKCENLNDVADAFNVLKENIIIIRIKNRFLPQFDSKETDGYRDMLINVLYKDEKTKLSAICEVQFQLNAYLDIKKKQHKYYKIVRAMDYKSLLRNWEARKFD